MNVASEDRLVVRPSLLVSEARLDPHAHLQVVKLGCLVVEINLTLFGRNPACLDGAAAVTRLEGFVLGVDEGRIQLLQPDGDGGKAILAVECTNTAR